eukprot:scaffold22592_cov129-Cylindrotheca_fusiformis.AAC.19
MRRRGRSPTTYVGTNTVSNEDVMMDEDDQAALIAELEKEAAEQMEQFQRYFSYIGCFAIVISLGFPFLCQEECKYQLESCWIHATYASIVHGLSLYLARGKGKDNKWFIMAFFCITIPLFLWVKGAFHEDVEHFHVGLALSNVTTFGGSILLRWDDRSTSASIQDLNRLKYPHKAL